MGSRDPMREWLRLRIAQEGGDPEINPAEAHLLRRFQEVYGAREGGGAVNFFLRNFPTGVYRRLGLGGVLDVTGVGDPEREGARSVARGAGILDFGILRPLEGLMGMTADIAERSAGFRPDLAVFDARQVEDFFRRLREGLLTTAEESAITAGMQPDEVARAIMGGQFIGITAPIAASVKVASTALRAPVTLTRWPFAGNLVTDSVAGLVYGFAFEPAGEGLGGVGSVMPFTDTDTRISNMARESAIFGVGRLVMGGLIPLRVWRERRLLSSLAHEEISDVFNRALRGDAISNLTARQRRILTAMLNEESYISGSIGAQHLLDRGAHEAALVQGILDLGRGDATAGVIRSMGRSFDDATVVIRNLKREFPHLKFDVVKRKIDDAVEYDVFFGLRGLSNKQRAQLAREGRFEGQQLQHAFSGGQYTYLGKGKKEGFIRVKRDDGKIVAVREANVTDLPTFVEPEARAPHLDAIYQDFRAFFYDKADDLRRAQAGLTEEDVIRGVREGSITIDPSQRRAFDLGGAIVYPEELGLQVGRGIMTPDEVLTRISREGYSGGRLLENPVYVSFNDVFDLWARERGITGAADLAAARVGFTSRMRREMWSQVPAEERALYDSLLAEQLKLVDEARLPLSSLAHQKGFNFETLVDDSIILREINTGARFIFRNSVDAEGFLKGVVRPEQDLPTIIPSLRGGMGLYNGGLPDPGSLWNFDKMVSLEPAHIPRGRVRNRWNMIQQFEEMTGVPLWSQGMLHVDQGQTIMRARYAPWAKEIEQTWKGIPLQRRQEVAELWRTGEAEGWTIAKTTREMVRRGFSKKEVNAFLRSRATLDKWFEMSGIDANRYINLYYSRIRPYLESTKGQDITRALRGMEERPPGFDFWAELTRTGDLATVEMDPMVVLHKYIRGLLWRDHVKPHWDRLARLTGTADRKPLRFRDLPVEDRKRIFAIARARTPDVTPDAPVVPEPVRMILLEYLNSVRGTPHASSIALRDGARGLFRKLGVELDGRIAEEFIHTMMAAQYGALMGIRPWHVARNITQVLWLMYPRLGNKHQSRGLERALSREGMEEVFNEGVLRLHEAGVPYADVIFEQIRHLPIDVTGVHGYPVKAAIMALVRSGQLSRSLSQKFLTYYTSGDALNRSWTYWWQKLHTDRALQRYEMGRTSWDKFMAEGLPMYGPTVKDKFREILRVHGRERALRFIGKVASDQTNFIYGGGVQPALMQTWYGKLLGTFGTWPVWAVEGFYTQPLKYGTMAEKAAFYARIGILAGAFSNIMLQTSYNLFSWMAPTSIFWAGGPYWDVLDTMRRVISGPLNQKATALRQLATTVPGLFVPGIAFYGDLMRAGEAESPEEAALGIMLGRSFDNPHWAMDVVYNPVFNQGQRPLPPETIRMLQEEGRSPAGEIRRDLLGPSPFETEAPLPIGGGLVPAPGGSMRMTLPPDILPRAGDQSAEQFPLRGNIPPR